MDKIYNKPTIKKEKTRIKDLKTGKITESEYPSIMRVIEPTKDHRISERKLI